MKPPITVKSDEAPTTLFFRGPFHKKDQQSGLSSSLSLAFCNSVGATTEDEPPVETFRFGGRPMADSVAGASVDAVAVDKGSGRGLASSKLISAPSNLVMSVSFDDWSFK